MSPNVKCNNGSHVQLECKNLRYGRKKIPEYYCIFRITSELATKLKWNRFTYVRFIWGANDTLGKLRIVAIDNPGAGGWKVRSNSDGSVSIHNKVLPETIDKNVTRNIKVADIQVIEVDTRLFLQLTLPEDFYIIGSRPTTTVKQVITKPKQTKNIVPHYDTNHYVSTTIKPEPKRSYSIQHHLPVSNTELPEVITDTTLLGISSICRYIRTIMGDQASVIDARTVIINDKQYSHIGALDYANSSREGNPPFRLRPTL